MSLGSQREMQFNGTHVQSQGEGTPAFLLHGISSSADAFRFQLAGLSETYQVFAWDAPGYARSADPIGSLTLEQYAQSVVDMLDALGLDTVHLLGTSWGGVIATRFALLFPARLRSLTLINSTVGRGSNPSSQADLNRRVNSLREDGIAAFAKRRVATLLGSEAPESLREEVRHTIENAVRLPGFAQSAATLSTVDHASRIGEIRVPTLVLAGNSDRLTGVGEGQRLADGIVGSRFVILNGGHLLHQENPAETNAIIQAFWLEVDATTGRA